MYEYSITEPATGYTHEAFRMALTDEESDGTPPVLSCLRPGGYFSVVTVNSHRSSFRGPSRGVVPAESVLNTMAQPGLVSSGGNYSHYSEWRFLWDIGLPRTQGRLYKYAVGENSLAGQYVPVPRIQQGHWQKRVATDGSFISMGPSLVEPLHMPSSVDARKASSWDRSFAYLSELPPHQIGRNNKSPLFASLGRADDALGELLTRLRRGDKTTLSMSADIEGALRSSKIMVVHHGKHSYKIEASAEQMINRALEVLPALTDTDDEYKVVFFKVDPHHPLIRGQASLLAGSWSHARERNERSAKVTLKNGTGLDLAYTCATRDEGLDMSEWRSLIWDYLSFKSVSREDVQEIWNSDGSTNIVQYLKTADGSVRVLAKGGLKGTRLPATVEEIPLHLKRSCPNYYILRTEQDDCKDHSYLVDPEFVHLEEEREYATISGAPDWVEDEGWADNVVAQQLRLEDAMVAKRSAQINAAETLIQVLNPSQMISSENEQLEHYRARLHSKSVMKVIYGMGAGTAGVGDTA